MSREAKAWKHGHIDFGLREKPKETLPKNGNSIDDYTRGLSGSQIQRGKKVRAREAIGEQANAGRKENAEN